MLMATIYLAIRVYHQKAYYMGYFKTDKKIRNDAKNVNNNGFLDNSLDHSKLNVLLNKYDDKSIDQEIPSKNKKRR